MVTEDVFLQFLALMPAPVNLFSIFTPSRELCVGLTFFKLDRRTSKIEIISLFQSRKTESLLKGDEEDEVATKLQAAFKAMQVC